ncbi:MAG: hypothetical protein ACON4A_08765 [Flavobacteriaceae bacterium]
MHKQWIFGFLLLSVFLLPQSAYGQWTLGGSTITVAGTQADLTGLSAIAGVTTTAVGTGDTRYTVYHVGNRKLNITGTLTIDPRKEQILFDTSAPTATVDVANGGTLNLGIQDTFTGSTVVKYDRATPFVFSRGGGQSWTVGHAHIRVRNGGTMNLYGTTLYLNNGRSLFYENGSFGVIRDAQIRSKTGAPRIYLTSTNLDINGLEVFDMNSVNLNGALTQLVNFIPYNVNWPVFFNGGANDNRVIPVRNFDEVGSDYTIVGQGATKFIFINKVNGSQGMTSVLRGVSGTAFVVETRKEVRVNLLDDNGPIQGANIYIADIDHGNRSAYTAGNAANDFDYRQDITYFVTTDGNGDTSTLDVLTSATVVNSGADAGRVTDANPVLATIDYRGKTTDGTDAFDLHMWSYNHVYKSIERELRGADVLEVAEKLEIDTHISQTDTSTVAAYSTIDNLDQFYDAAKYWKTQNQTQMEYPAIDQPLLQADGNVLDLGTMDLIVDPAATNAFSVSTTGSGTITLKANTLGVGEKFTSITTSGTITLQATSVANFGYEDQNGKKKFVEVRGLTSATVEVRDYAVSTTTPTILVQSGGVVNGTYSASFDEPDDPSNTVIAIARVGFTPSYQLFPQEELSYTSESVLVPIRGLAENQEVIINYVLKLLQKAEAIRNHYRNPPADNPTLTVSTTANTATGDATVGNQEKVISLLQQILLRLTAINETVR